MELKLCWGESYANSVLVFVGQNDKECFEHINTTLDRADFKSYYFRRWNIIDNASETVQCIDYGSHRHFFFIVYPHSSE